MAFSSLNLLLHTQALLSSINYLTTIIPSDGQKMDDTKEVQVSTEKQQKIQLCRKVRKTLLFLVSKDFQIVELSEDPERPSA